MSGARRGRPTGFFPAGAECKKHGISIPDADWEALKRIGGGNASEGVRWLIRERSQNRAGKGERWSE